MNFKNIYSCYEPNYCDSTKFDYKLPYYNISPNAIGQEQCSKVWYKMKDGYIYQYSYVPNDDINYVTQRRYQKYSNMMSDLQEIYKNEKKN